MFGRLPKTIVAAKVKNVWDVSEIKTIVAANWQNVWEVSETKTIVAEINKMFNKDNCSSKSAKCLGGCETKSIVAVKVQNVWEAAKQRQ